MLSINTNMGALIAANQLNKLNNNQMKLQEQATTGKRINHASDDAAGLAMYMGMQSSLTGNNAALQNIGHGTDLLNTYEGTITQINDIFTRMTTLATSAADSTMSAADRTKSNTELQGLMTEIDRIANTTNYNGIKLGDGSTASIDLQVGSGTTANDKITVGLSDLRTSAMSITGGDVTTAANATTFLTNLQTDVNNYATKLATVGAYQNRLSYAKDNLTNMNTNLQSSMSTLMDADMAQVAKDQAKNQTLSQLGLKMIQTANAQPMSYLSMFA